MSDTCPGAWVGSRAPQLAAEEGGSLAWGGRGVRADREGELGDGRWPEAQLQCHVRAANVGQGTIATIGSHIWDFPL